MRIDLGITIDSKYPVKAAEMVGLIVQHIVEEEHFDELADELFIEITDDEESEQFVGEFRFGPHVGTFKPSKGE